MTRIPKNLREEMEVDPFYQRCCITGEKGTRADPIEWHHNLIFAGCQTQEKFCILPVKRSIHALANRKGIKAKLDWVMLSRASEEQLERFSKVIDQRFRLSVLETIYGKWIPPTEEESGINY